MGLFAHYALGSPVKSMRGCRGSGPGSCGQPQRSLRPEGEDRAGVERTPVSSSTLTAGSRRADRRPQSRMSRPTNDEVIAWLWHGSSVDESAVAPQQSLRQTPGASRDFGSPAIHARERLQLSRRAWPYHPGRLSSTGQPVVNRPERSWSERCIARSRRKPKASAARHAISI
jgi:hypothetical protein